jgi:DnaK suppressor protein
VKEFTVARLDIDFFRRLLNERKQELLNEAGKTVDGMDGEGNLPDPTDRASLESDRNFILRIRDRERKLIAKIDEALRRLEDGTYGVCEECGETIGTARLKARPVTTLCIECKSAQEVGERKNRFA